MIIECVLAIIYYFKCSSSTWMEDMVPKPSSECSRILEGVKELFDKLKLVDQFEIGSC